MVQRVLRARGTRLGETLPDALTGQGNELLGLVEHEVGVAGVITRAVAEHHGQLGRVVDSSSWTNTSKIGVFVINSAVMIPVEASWAQTLSTCLPWHAEGDHDPAALLCDHLLGRHGQVLEAEDGAAKMW